MKGFTGGEAASITGVSYDRVDKWARRGFLEPSIVPAKGKGSKRLYSFADLVILRTIDVLRNIGLGMNRLQKVVCKLAQLDLEGLSDKCYLIITGEDDSGHIFLTAEEQQLIDILNSHSAAVFIVLDLAIVINELREKINEGNEIEMQSHPAPRYDAPRALEVVPGRGPMDKGVGVEISTMLQEINREFLEEIKEAEERRRKRWEMATSKILRLLEEKQRGVTS